MASHGYLLPTRGAVFSSRSTEELTARVQADVIGLAQRAEALGFEGVWVGDSVLAKPRLEPLSTLAAVGAATDAVTLGTAVYLPALRHPVNVAHATATVDQLSGGHLSLGVGVGVRPAERREHEQLGVPFERRGALLNDGLDVVTSLWSGEAIDHEGDATSLEDANIGFSPARTPPIYVASAAVDPERGFPRTIRERLTRFASGWLPIAITPDEYAAGLERIEALLADAGREDEPFDPAYYHDVVIADTEAEAVAEAKSFYERYYSADDPSYDDSDGLSEEAVRERGTFGPPELVSNALDRYREAGVETFVTRFLATNQREQLARYAELIE